ncbi:MAG: DNA mismatch repair protein MutS [Candidatus Eisenbacteria bacterium]|nr:DNA mismatch repair protein MutS [Candidatus Eisenbacteria bacterium]
MAELTPMMRQYRKIKGEHGDALLLFRMGDFYETFFEDAKTASDILGIALTTRDKGSDNPIPLAGIPYHALDNYLARLVAAGIKVAICDQVEDPKKARGLVKREVTEIVTPGTVMGEGLLDDGRSSYLVAVAPSEATIGMARVDLSTGEFSLTELAPGDVRREVLRADAAEIVVPETAAEREPLRAVLSELGGVTVTRLADWEFTPEEAASALREHFGVANLDGFGATDMPSGVAAAGAAIRYLRDLKRRDLTQITTMRSVSATEHMVLDETTQRNLELVEPMERGLEEATLFAVLDRTVTAMGARLLRQWILYPLLDVDRISARHDAVEELLDDAALRENLRSILSELCDVARVIGRVASGHASPRDLAHLRRSLELAPQVSETCTASKGPAVASLGTSLPDVADVEGFLAGAVTDSPPASLRDGGVIREGFDDELDRLRTVTRDGKGWIGRLQTRERERTGIPSLKIGFNKVFGYYIEIRKTHLEAVPDDYIRKQTLVNAERFVTPELKEHEETVLTAEEDMSRLEAELFEGIRSRVAESAPRIQELSNVLARIDVLAGLAESAAESRFVRPSVDRSGSLLVQEGRHPVVESLLHGERFVPNDLDLSVDERQILLITGPNMAGKSTYLRQTALIVIMAQLGSFVPAREARVGLVDRVFTRIGATDALARGRSTFLVEMSETANILRNATDRSLVLLDEIGRGTSTFDGLSIAWAVTEHLHNREQGRPRTLFATHYHELTELADVLPRLWNMNVLVRETGDTISFLRRVVPGSADQSYGIEVARLAGVPDEVIARAGEVLRNLESTQYGVDEMPRLAAGEHGPLGPESPQLALFERRPSQVERELSDIDLESMTPLEAFDRLRKLKEEVQSDT